MYFVDREQIERRLTYIETTLLEAVRQLEQASGDLPSIVSRFGWERVLHLAIESVTDIGSLMIDGFIMRDASSYEDIIDILRDETVLDDEIGAPLYELVKLRRSLVQYYFELEDGQFSTWYPQIEHLLVRFKQSVEQYLEQELGPSASSGS